MDLTDYMAKSSNKYATPGNVVNCYDQATAVCSFGCLLGIDVQYNFMDPFGCINTLNLVGVGSCNNPFYGRNNTSAVVAPNSPRSGFGNHAFAVFNGYVFDACAAPISPVPLALVGTQTTAQYIAGAIDVSLGVSGNASNIRIGSVILVR